MALNCNNLILRGCSLKNTEKIVGMVAYTGHDTKIMMNSVNSKIKHSSVEKKMNYYIELIFFLQCVWTFFTSVMSFIWFKLNYF